MASIESVKGIAVDLGYPVIGDTYRARPLIFPSFVSLLTEAEMHDFPYGTQQGSYVGGGASEVPFGMPLPSSTVSDGYVRQMKIRKLGGSIPFERELFQSRKWQETFSGSFVEFCRSQARSIRNAKEQLAANVLQKGTLSAGDVATFDQSYRGKTWANGGKSYDNVSFFNASHPIKLGGSATYSNITTSLSLSATNLATAESTMVANAKDERGEIIDIVPNRLIVPQGLKHTALAIVNSALQAGTSNNDENTLRGQYTVVVNPFLRDDADAWWLMDAEMMAIRGYDSGEPVIEVTDDPVNQLVHVGIYSYFGVAPWEGRGVHACNKATS